MKSKSKFKVLKTDKTETMVEKPRQPRPRPRRLEVMYKRTTREKQVFMDELKAFRKLRQKRLFKKIKTDIGPKWYQALSVVQRNSLDNLNISIYQDLIEGRPVRTMKLLKILDIHPLPQKTDLFTCVYIGRNDPKEFMAALYFILLGRHFDQKFITYSLNAKLILSAILYLGMDNLIEMLKERFKPVPIEKPPKPKPKPKKLRPKSPYLEKFEAVLYGPTGKPKRRMRPPPLPNLEELDKQPPIPKVPVFRRAPPPPPPPPPPKKKIAIAYCENLAGILKLEPPPIQKEPNPAPSMRHLHKKKLKHSKVELKDTDVVPKKKYGIGIQFRKKQVTRKPVAPKTNMDSTNYLILGVYTIKKRSYYILGSVSFSLSNCEVIHGGHRRVDEEYVFINLGLRAREERRESHSCDCIQKWNDPVMKYLNETKCTCNHRYDFRNEGTLPKNQEPYFEKPTGYLPFSFDYSTIIELEPKIMHIQREIKKIWKKDSLINVDNPQYKSKIINKKKPLSSTTCLGTKPTARDYLKCALQMMMQVNLAARLPDVHLVPELKEWMRRRLHGPCTRHQKGKLLNKSNAYWAMLRSMDLEGVWHLDCPLDKSFKGLSNWKNVPMLRSTFRDFTRKYKRSIHNQMAKLNNLLWASMCQAEFPSQRFREIYFDYVAWRYRDLLMLGCYSPKETNERTQLLSAFRRYCFPKGMEPSVGGQKKVFMKWL